jgi:hypothetical protein
MSCHIEGSEQNRKLVAEHGERVAWFKRGGPEATLDALRKGRLIDVDEPEKSLLLLKPLNRVKHGGGVKFAEGDQGYKAFRSFIEDYARITKGGYRDAASLPRDEGLCNSAPSAGSNWSTPRGLGRLAASGRGAPGLGEEVLGGGAGGHERSTCASKPRLWQHTSRSSPDVTPNEARRGSGEARTSHRAVSRQGSRRRRRPLAKDWKATLVKPTSSDRPR